MKKIFLVLGLISGLTLSALAQDPSVQSNDPTDFKADRYSFKTIDSANQLQIMAGNVVMKQGTTTFYADSAIFNRFTRIVEAFGNVHINDNDSIDTYSQYLHYHVDTKIALLKRKVRLTDGQSNLYTEELEYDVNQKIGIYRNGGRVVNKSSVLTSTHATYYADVKDVYFKQNVLLKDPQYTLRSDSLLYNTESEIATFIAQTVIEDSIRRIRTSDGYYDMKNRNAFFGRRPIINDGPVTIIANEIETDDFTGINKLHGNAIYKDTAQGISILANYIESDKNSGSFFATRDPLMILKQENDSIFISADTLASGRLSLRFPELADTAQTKSSDMLSPGDSSQQDSSVTVLNAPARAIDTAATNDSTDRYFMAWHNVRVFSDSLQAVADSLFYSGKDSIFRLFIDPVVWASGSQVTGDTIYLYTKNKKAERLYVFENGLVINKSGENMFNQVRGNRLNGFFTDGAIDRMRAQGNAESVYYVRDDQDLLVGINKASSDIIEMRFRNKEMHEVIFISEVAGTMYPVHQISEEDKKLRNFDWREALRPKSRFELYERPESRVKQEELDNEDEMKVPADEDPPEEDD